jgi:hypothetical protein
MITPRGLTCCAVLCCAGLGARGLVTRHSLPQHVVAPTGRVYLSGGEAEAQWERVYPSGGAAHLAGVSLAALGGGGAAGGGGLQQLQLRRHFISLRAQLGRRLLRRQPQPALLQEPRVPVAQRDKGA